MRETQDMTIDWLEGLIAVAVADDWHSRTALMKISLHLGIEREITVAGVTNLLLSVYKSLYQRALETSLLY